MQGLQNDEYTSAVLNSAIVIVDFDFETSTDSFTLAMLSQVQQINTNLKILLTLHNLKLICQI
ncbi:MAG: hypothetical protein DRI23_09265 [Candidatus Cloacimonadota bacterium]|nr:MAG: hypothetical protein DRI23_09265 [Candidatus Cloacimonadota bacterium]RLC54048.1 MAG: hypothetical protein DRH79_01840 [Candidatus Cloacimonadota bacterium]